MATEVLRLTLDTKDAARAAKATEDALVRLGERAKRLQASFDRTSPSAGRAGGAMRQAAGNSGLLGRAMDDASRSADRMGRSARRSADGIRQIDRRAGQAQKSVRLMTRALGAVGVGVSVIGITRVSANLIRLGAAAEDARSKFLSVFGAESAGVSEFLDDFASSAGLARTEAEDLISTMGNVIIGLGLTRRESAQLSEQILRAAGDLSSFHGESVSTERAINAIRGAIVGEREALKTLGVVLNDQEVRQQAIVEAQERGIDATSRAASVYATMTLILDRMGEAQGDLERTQDSLTNQLDQLGAELSNIGTQFGLAFTPAVTETVIFLNENFEILVVTIGAATAALVAFGTAAAVSALGGVGALIRGLGPLLALGGPGGIAFAGLAALGTGFALSGAVGGDRPDTGAGVDEFAENVRRLRELAATDFVEALSEINRRMAEIQVAVSAINDLGPLVPQVFRDPRQALRDIEPTTPLQQEFLDRIRDHVNNVRALPPGQRDEFLRRGVTEIIAEYSEQAEALDAEFQRLSALFIQLNNREQAEASRIEFADTFAERSPEEILSRLEETRDAISTLADQPSPDAAALLTLDRLREEEDILERLYDSRIRRDLQQEESDRQEAERIAERLAQLRTLSEEALITVTFEAEGLGPDEINRRVDELRGRQELLGRLPSTAERELELEFIPRYIDALLGGLPDALEREAEEQERLARAARERSRQDLLRSQRDRFRAQQQQLRALEGDFAEQLITLRWEVEPLPQAEIDQLIEDYERRLDLLLRLRPTRERDLEIGFTRDAIGLLRGITGTGEDRESVRLTEELISALADLTTVVANVWGGGSRQNAAVGGQVGAIAGGLAGLAFGQPGLGSLIGSTFGSIIGSFVGGGPDPDIIRRNTAAIRALTIGITDGLDALGGTTGNAFSAFETALTLTANNFNIKSSDSFDELNRRLAGTGYTLEDLQAFANALGIDLVNSRDSLNALIEAMQAAEGAFYRTREGLLDLVRIRAGLADTDDDPALLFQQLFQTALPTLQGELRRLFIAQDWLGILDLITSQDFDFGDLGGLSLNALISLIQELERLQDEAGELANSLGDVTEVLNAPSGFKVALEEFNATDVSGTGRSVDTGGPGSGEDDPPRSGSYPSATYSPDQAAVSQSTEQHNYYFDSGAFNITTDVSAEEFLDELERELERRRARGGVSSFDLPRSVA